ncbi:Uncharacterized protein AC511_0795 [Pseudomonas coronafaciens pv. oryzae]|nr:Uncharacterized protein AC511_0795 [Pseudomonas coronafaciens pv. oryzae]
MAPEQSLCAVREDIAHLRAAPTQSSCANQHAAIHVLCRTLFRIRVISAAQFNVLLSEADAEPARWQSPTQPRR